MPQPPDHGSSGPRPPTTSDRPLIALVGSISRKRRYDPPLAQAEEAQRACEELGRELAVRQCRIVVYSADPGFVEPHVVRGYVSSGCARARSIQVRCPVDRRVDFPEARQNPEVFDPRFDSSGDWEISFYRSLAQTDGALLLGGGWSTYVAGLFALSHRLPVVPVASFGGNAKKVWAALNSDRDHALSSQDEIHAMAHDWSPRSAAVLVQALLTAHQRRAAADRDREDLARSRQRRSTISAVVAALLLVLAVAAIPASSTLKAGTPGPVAALVLAPLLAGAAGSVMRVIFDAGRDFTRTAVLGLAAGGMTVLLFVAAQIAATPGILDTDGSRRLLFFAVPAGFFGGFTFDVLYQKLKAEPWTNLPMSGRRSSG